MIGYLPDMDQPYELLYLEDSGNKEMNVDGSSVNKVYKQAVPTNEIWMLEGIHIFMLDPGLMAHNVFGSLGSVLTNGLSIVVKKKESDFKIKDIMDNTDLYMAFPSNQNVGNSGTGFLDEEDYFYGTLHFQNPLRLAQSDGDLVKMIVKDDLTAIQRLRATILIRKVI